MPGLSSLYWYSAQSHCHILGSISCIKVGMGQFWEGGRQRKMEHAAEKPVGDLLTH